MKIVIFGLTVSSSWGNGHATLWRALVSALARRGHRVAFFERDVPYYAEHRDCETLEDADLHIYRGWTEAQPLARRELADADLAIVTSYCGDSLVATDLVLSSSARLKAFYDLDTPVTLDCLASGRPVNYVGPRGLADFDFVLSYTGGRALHDLQSKLGARRVAPLYGSVDPSVHHPLPSDPRFSADLSYLGTYASDRQSVLEDLFIEPARRLPHQRFLLGGAQYPPEFPWAENIFFVHHVAPYEHAAFYSSSRLTLNVTRRAMKEMGYCPSGRLFEAAACGAPTLSDWWEGLDLFFTPGSEILVARSTDDAVAALELGGDELARIAHRARERALAEHTAEHRARELELILDAVASERPQEQTRASADAVWLAQT